MMATTATSRARSLRVYATDLRTQQGVRAPAKRVGVHETSKEKQRQKQKDFAKAWLPRLLQTQEEVSATSARAATFGERLAAEVTKAQSRLTEVMQQVLTPLGIPDQQQQQGFGSSRIISRLNSTPPPTADGLPDELAGIVQNIQATNQKLRAVEESLESVDRSLGALRAGAESRDQQTAAYADALLQLADDLEAQEEVEAKAEAQQALAQAKEAQAAAAQAEAAAARELDGFVAAASAAAVPAADGSGAATTTGAVRVKVGVRLQTRPGQDVLLVGSHAALGNWDVAAALPMLWTDGHVWRADLELPLEGAAEEATAQGEGSKATVEFKAVVRGRDGGLTWESGGNRVAELAAAAAAGGELELVDAFRA